MTAPTTYRKPPSWLAGIPGYAGYHAKDQRRQADHALREELAQRIGVVVERCQRLSADLARARRFADLAPVDALTGRLHLLADRLRAAPEGYRGLFADTVIDEAVLDQVIAFDQSLASGIERAATLANQLSAATSGPVLETAAATELLALVERLFVRLDARGAVLTSGVKATPEQALAALQDPAPAVSAINPKVGDAISYGTTDFITDAVVTYRGDRSWTEFRLRDGSAEHWLLVLPGQYVLAEPLSPEEVSLHADDSLTVGPRAYRRGASGQATANLLGPSGGQQNIPVTFADYADATDGVVALREWGSERRLLRGMAIDPAFITVYARR